ncbi:MAG: hypothetical protein EA404_08790 [Spirochaetaceae bacterium]|nr:MAG: hypothetical protein EA404_08790 [Spirochaetaceae bacterium]
MNRCWLAEVRYAILVGIVLMLMQAAPGHAQFVGYDWALGLRHQSARVGDGEGGEFSSVDSLGASVEFYHQIGDTVLTYRGAVGAAYSAQRGIAFAPLPEDLIVYPGLTGVGVLRKPPIRAGAWLEAELGRLALDEPSGLLFSDTISIEPVQLADGMRVAWRWPGSDVAVTVAYLGLLDAAIDRISAHPDPDQLPNSANAIALVTLGARELVAQQDGSLVLLARYDFAREMEREGSYFLGVVATGPIMHRVDQQTALIGALSTSDNPRLDGVSLLLSAQATYRPDTVWIGSLWSQLRYASGGANLARFPELAGPNVGTAFAEKLSDIVSLELGAGHDLGVAPRGAVLSPELALRLFLVPSGEPTARTGVDPSGRFAGFEVSPSIRYHLIRGLDVASNAAFLFANDRVRSLIGFEGRISL